MYAQHDQTESVAARDRVITSDEYQIGYSEGWEHALAWANASNGVLVQGGDE